MSKIFEVFNNWDDNYRVASHFELMQDFPSLSEWGQFAGAFDKYVNSYLAGASLGSPDASAVTVFFPPLKYETIENYIRRLSKTCPFNIYKIAINSIIGLMTRKEALIKNKEDSESDFLLNVGGGSSYQSLIERQIFPAIMSGIGGILVDFQNNQIVWKIFDARKISKRNMKKIDIAGEQVLTRVVIVEDCESENEEYEYESERRAFVMKLIAKADFPDFEAGNPVKCIDRDSEDLSLSMAVWEVFEEEESEIVREKFGTFLSSSQEPFDRIPFFIFDSGENDYPPFFSAARKSFKLAEMESFFDESLMISNYPILKHKKDKSSAPILTTRDETTGKQTLKISHKSVIEIDKEDELEYLEWEGTTFEVTLKRMAAIQDQIGQMIINRLSDQASQRTKAQYEGEQMTNTSVLIYLINSCEQAIQNAVVASCFFLGIPEEKTPLVSLNTDLVKESTDANLLNAYVQSWKDEFLSRSTIIRMLKQKELVPNDIDANTEIENILAEINYLGTDK